MEGVEALWWSVMSLVTVGVSAVALKRERKRRRRREAAAKDGMLEAVMRETSAAMAAEPVLRAFLRPLLEAESFEEAVALSLAERLAGRGISRSALFAACRSALGEDESARRALRVDCEAVLERDPACSSRIEVLLFFKGYAALAAHRVARRAWRRGETQFALWLQARVSEVCGVDIHPGATIGCGVMLDHATGVVVGETASIGDGCSILHGVTLGSNGKEKGDRHPKVGRHVLIGAGASILGNITVGDGAKVGSGAVVLRPIPAGATAVGAPAKIVGRATEAKPAETADNGLYNVKPAPGTADIACVWREIAKHATPQAQHLGIQAFRAALAPRGLADDEIGNLFFQLDADNDGLVAKDDLRRFPDAALKFCKHSCACPVKRAELGDFLVSQIDQTSLSKAKAAAYPPAKPALPKTPSDLESAKLLVAPVA